MTALEKRLYNTELALHCLWNLLAETVPSECRELIDSMMEDYFLANNELGSNFDMEPEFLTEDS
jgi:hypothetical protein